MAQTECFQNNDLQVGKPVIMVPRSENHCKIHCYKAPCLKSRRSSPLQAIFCHFLTPKTIDPLNPKPTGQLRVESLASSAFGFGQLPTKRFRAYGYMGADPDIDI